MYQTLCEQENAALRQRIAALEAQVQSLIPYQQFFEQAWDGHMLVNEQGIIVDWNKGMERIMHLPREAVVGHSTYEVKQQLIPQDQQAVLFAQARGALQQLIPPPQCTVTPNEWAKLAIQTTDGEHRTISYLFFPIHTETGTLSGGITRDVTEQVQAEESLRQSQELLHNIIEHIPASIFVKDWNGRFLLVNRHAAAQIGLTPQAMLHKTQEEFYSPKLTAQWDEEERATFTTGLTRKLEVTGIFDGQEQTVLSFKFPLHDAQGAIYAIGIIATDITERKQTEEAIRQNNLELEQRVLERTQALEAVVAALQKSESRFRTLVESAPFAILIQQNRQVFYANPATVAITSYTLQEISHLPIAQFVHQDSLAVIDNHEQLLLRGEQQVVRYSIQIYTKNGEQRWLDVTSSLIDFEERPAILVSGLDSTEYRQAEAARQEAYARLEAVNSALQRSRDLLRTILDTIQDGLMLLDAQGVIQAANLTMAAFLGYTNTASLIGQSWQQVTSRSPNGSQHLTGFPNQCLTQALQEAIPCKRREHIRQTDAISRIFDIQTIPLCEKAGAPTQLGQQGRPTQKGQVIGVVVHMSDMTEQLRMKAMMIEHERFSTMQRMTHIVAHEVNTPLQTILTTLERMQFAPAKKRTAFLEVAQEEVQRIGHMLHQLMDTYKTTPSKHGQVDMMRIVNRVLLLTSGRLAKLNIRVERTVPSPVPIIHGSADELTQVIINLIINAMEAMPTGGTLHISCYKEGQAKLALVIADTGQGIAPDVQPHIFEPFFTTRQAGTGLGLFVCRRIIINHHGTITVESNLGQGTTCTIRLPLQSEESPRPFL